MKVVSLYSVVRVDFINNINLILSTRFYTDAETYFYDMLDLVDKSNLEVHIKEGVANGTIVLNYKIVSNCGTSYLQLHKTEITI